LSTELTREAQSVQRTSTGTYILRFAKDTAKIPASVSGQIIRNETVGPVLGAELLKKTVTAALVAIIAILLYVAYAFKNFKFGISAVIALIHDLLVVVGCFSLFGHFFNVEVDTLFVTAFLTTMSFSVHDTIVVFDRIREMLKRGDRLPFNELCDKAMTETIGRSTANSLTIVFMLLALVLLGGETIRWFVIALLIGTVSGTYSSPFVATPILILWDRWEKRKMKGKI
jgi:preprotein translocase subunit SecF